MARSPVLAQAALAIVVSLLAFATVSSRRAGQDRPDTANAWPVTFTDIA
jgi:hypothetical protein